MRAILWCNGSAPGAVVMDRVLEQNADVFGVDGGADKAAEKGIVVKEVLGDLDSVDLSRWSGKTTELPNQDSSDLAKSIEELIGRGYEEIDIVGAGGGSSSHILGNWAALCDAPGGAKVRIHHNDSVTVRVHPDDGGFDFFSGDSEEFSVFALEKCKVWISGSRWEIKGEEMAMSTRGMSNRGLGQLVSISGDGVLAVLIPG